MAKVFANGSFWDVIVIYWMQCFILQEMWGVVCAILGFVSKVLKMSVSSWKTVIVCDMQRWRANKEVQLRHLVSKIVLMLRLVTNLDTF